MQWMVMERKIHLFPKTTILRVRLDVWNRVQRETIVDDARVCNHLSCIHLRIYIH